MLAEIAAGLSSLKAAKDIVQGLNAAKTEAAINSIKIDLQGLILEAQQGLFAAQQAQSTDARRIAQLEQEVVRLKDWSAEKERYQPVNTGRGGIAYMPKIGMENGEPAHWLCANCFNQGRKSYLQFKGNEPQSVGGAISKFGCDDCRGSLVVGWSSKPDYSKRHSAEASSNGNS